MGSFWEASPFLHSIYVLSWLSLALIRSVFPSLCSIISASSLPMEPLFGYQNDSPLLWLWRCNSVPKISLLAVSVCSQIPHKRFILALRRLHMPFVLCTSLHTCFPLLDIRVEFPLLSSTQKAPALLQHQRCFCPLALCFLSVPRRVPQNADVQPCPSWPLSSSWVKSTTINKIFIV